MQALGNSQIAIQTQPGITPPTTTTVPSAGHEIEVGQQGAPQGVQTAKKYPKIQQQVGMGTVFSSNVLGKPGLLQALGTAPSTSAKAKTAFASAFNKVANVFGFKGVRKSDFIGITKAAKEYAAIKAESAQPGSTVTTAEVREKLLALKDKITSHQTRHPGKLENLPEVGEMVDAELEKLDLVLEKEALDASPDVDKTERYAALLKKFVAFAERNPSNLSNDEEKGLVASLHKKIAGDGQKVGGGVHKLYMECIQSEIRNHAQKSSDGTLLRGNGDVLLSKPHAYAVVNDHLKGVVLDTMTDIHGSSLEVDPSKLTPEEQGNCQGRMDRLGVCFGNFCDRMGISSDPEVQQDGLNALPQELCDQAKCLYEEVLAAGHNEAAARRAVTSLVMLKLVCPMLLAPQSTDASPCQITEQPMSAEDQRNMTLLSKVIQNMANGIAFKEEYMLPFNDLIDSRKGGWSSFVDGVVARGRDFSEL